VVLLLKQNRLAVAEDQEKASILTYSPLFEPPGDAHGGRRCEIPLLPLGHIPTQISSPKESLGGKRTRGGEGDVSGRRVEACAFFKTKGKTLQKKKSGRGER